MKVLEPFSLKGKTALPDSHGQAPKYYRPLAIRPGWIMLPSGFFCFQFSIWEIDQDV